MVQRRRQPNKRQQTHAAARGSAPSRAPLAPLERKPPVVYGKPYVVLEDSQKSTFVYDGGAWVAHAKSIAEYRQDSQVKELSQKINGMTRYEVCAQIHPSN